GEKGRGLGCFSWIDQDRGERPAVLAGQNIEGTARGGRVHHFEADASGSERGSKPGMRKAQPRAAAKDHDLRLEFKQLFEVRGDQSSEARWRPVRLDSIREHDQALFVTFGVYLHVAGPTGFEHV